MFKDFLPNHNLLAWSTFVKRREFRILRSKGILGADSIYFLSEIGSENSKP